MQWRALCTGQCPQCLKGSLFHHVAGYRDTCPHCRLDISQYDVGDGPVFLAILLVGVILAVLATYTEFAYEPPVWLHAVLWIPFTLILTVITLRLLRTALVHAIYHHSATHTHHD